MHWWNFGCSAGWLGYLIWFLILFLVVFFLLRLFGVSSCPFTLNKESPLDILKRRYARGEITKEEFERMKKDIE
ncbi:MAG: SHOCT domain-containing protein [Candidatus Marinimicrobia bacterium]|nr:SHOCT domain-containing protein [Candidatus Neomarinimicrobiota bacterium]